MPICLSGVHRATRGCESTGLQKLVAYTACNQWSVCRQGRSHQRAGLRRHVSTYLHAGTIAVPDVSNLSTHGVLEHLRPIPESKLAGNSGDQSLLLLLTPGLARAVRDESLPVKVAQRLLGHRHLPNILESVTGVIDAVPANRLGQGRSEGVTYALCKRDDTPILLTSTQLRAAANKPGSLTFQLGLQHGSTSQSWELQLPLSQTIFSTGLTSTLIHRTHNTPAGDAHSSLIAERYLESVTFKLPNSSFSQLSIETFPLLPLTTCQIVKNSMGNIIRTVAIQASSDNPENEEPASTRLESAVTAYFEALALPPEPVNVWALIIPRDQVAGAEETLKASNITNLQQIWSDAQQQEQTHLQYSALLLELIRSGGRLVKVLSGGGGWGKKAGLLSLDPDLEHSTRELRDDFGWSFDFDDVNDSTTTSIEKGLDQALGNSVEEGDGLIFLIGQKQFKMNESGRGDARRDLQLRLGTCRPVEEASSEAHNESEARHIDTSAPDSFGFYSETGMSIKLTQDGRLVGRSKLEVPGLSIIACS